ncbi:MAG: NADP-dependent oxidoreductase [Ferruginibacter sp.]
MKAIVLKDFGSAENFALAELEKPATGDNEVLVRIKATAFNPIDYQMRRGDSESKLLKSPILGRELSGEVVEAGKNVHSFLPGDKVAAYVGSLASNGTYAEFISIPAELIAKIPSGISFEDAAALPMAGMTALQCFNRAFTFIPKEKPIFITGGAGGVGTMLIKLLLENGNNHIYTTAGNSDSIQHLKNIGLAENNILDYRKEDMIESLKSAAGVKYFDYVADLVGGKISETAGELVSVFGTYVDVTNLLTQKARELLFDKASTVVHIANYAPALITDGSMFKYYGNMLDELFSKIVQQSITPAPINIIGNLSVESVQKAHRLMENNETKGKKLVMTIH